MSIYLLDPETRVRQAVDRDGEILFHTKHVSDPETGEKIFAEKRASRNYTVVDPVETRDKLVAAGYETQVIRFRSPWKTALNIRIPGEVGGVMAPQDRYVREVGFLLTNKGDCAILGQGSAVRLACMNQFPNPSLRIRHIGEDAVRFKNDPASFVDDLVRFADIALERIDGLRGARGGWNFFSWTLENLQRLSEESRKAREAKLGRRVRKTSPRLVKALRTAWDKYRLVDGPSVWSAFQAVTETGSPRLIRWVGKVFSDDTAYRSAVGGDIPLGVSLN